MAWNTLGAASQPLLGFLNWALTPVKPHPKAPVILPTAAKPIQPTSPPELEAILQKLHANRVHWVETGTRERGALLRACIKTTLTVTEEAAAEGTAHKGSYGFGNQEERVNWLPILSGLRELAEAMEADGQPRHSGVRARPDGQLVVKAFPLGLEAMLYGGWKGEVWIEPGKPASQGELYQRKAAGGGQGGAGGVGLVLGAGNQLCVAALDVLHKLLLEDEVVVCKMNPVNEFYGPYLRRAFAPLVERGVFEVVYGGPREGAALVHHDLVSSIHLTGSVATHDAIVWGDKAKNKVGKPPLSKPVGAELGCVTPYIIVPGPWSKADMEYHAASVAFGMTHNAGHNCLAAAVVITDRDWPQREDFLAALRRALNELPRRVAYYPGSDKKTAAWRAQFPDAEELGVPPERWNHVVGSHGQPVDESEFKTQPWLLKTGLEPGQANLQDENWVGVLQEVALPCGGNAGTFLDKAVPFANEKAWGTLSCAVFIHPASQSAARAQWDRALADLRYGSINVNAPTVMGFCTTKLVWGGFVADSTLQDIGSGNCLVHNTLLLDHPQKAVLHAPWRYHPTPFWSHRNRNLAGLVPAALNFFAAPSLASLTPAALAALRG